MRACVRRTPRAASHSVSSTLAISSGQGADPPQVFGGEASEKLLRANPDLAGVGGAMLRTECEPGPAAWTRRQDLVSNVSIISGV